jgi:peptidylprolyl isomerase
MTSKAIATALAAAVIGVGVAACGGTATAPGVETAPSAGATQDVVTAAATTTSTTPTTVDITPKTGPLSTEPAFSVPSGAPPKTVQIKDLITGTGTAVAAGDQITVNYVGKIYKTGKSFGSTWAEKQNFGPVALSASSVIPGWVKGLVGMKVGGRRELIIPPSEGYGSSAYGSIPANSTLVFVIDLLKVSK